MAFLWHTARPRDNTAYTLPHEWHTDGEAAAPIFARLCLYGVGCARLGVDVPLIKAGKEVFTAAGVDGQCTGHHMLMSAPFVEMHGQEEGEQQPHGQQQHEPKGAFKPICVMGQMMSPSLSG